MKQVFSRWPSYARSSTLDEAGEASSGLPQWMLVEPESQWPERLRGLRSAALIVLLPALLSLTAGLLIGGGNVTGGWIQLVATMAVVIIAFVNAADLRRTIAEGSARFEAIFERAGISMWLEDWSAVGSEIASLRRSGVIDIEAHYASRPDQLRALRAQVMIKDVNAFTVEETGAPDKQAYIGSLDRLLPDTDQTFVQWLVAFGRGDRFFRSEAHVTKPDGTEIDTLFTAALPDDLDGFANIIATSFDVTNYKRQQTKLHAVDAHMTRAARTSTVGALSASIAHELNSPLAAMLANAQAAQRLLGRGKPDIGETLEAVAAIVHDATRAREVIERTRAFTANTASVSKPLDLERTAREANLLVEREIRDCGAVVHLEAEPGLPMAQGDPVQIQQVFTNLLLNAAQAMADRRGAKDIVITFRRSGANIRVEIADSGPGIERDQLEKIFDPFRSTKPDGMGLGLAICRTCIDAHGGNIWATSSEGCGATIHFTLPSHEG